MKTNPQETKVKIVLNEKEIRDAVAHYVHTKVLQRFGTNTYEVCVTWRAHKAEVEVDPK